MTFRTNKINFNTSFTLSGRLALLNLRDKDNVQSMLTYPLLFTAAVSGFVITNNLITSPLSNNNYSQCSFNSNYVQRCADWRIDSIILLTNKVEFKNKLDDIQLFLTEVTKHCNSTSHYQILGSEINKSNECTEYKVSRSSFNQNLTSTLAPLKSVNQIAEILSAKLEELADCTRRRLPKDNEARVLFIFLDSTCDDYLREDQNITEKQSKLMKDLLNAGYLIRFIYLSEEGDNLNCSLEKFSYCHQNYPNCDVEFNGVKNGTLVESASNFITCSPITSNDAATTGSNFSTLEIILLVTVPVALICVVACCCVWSFYRKAVRQMILQTVLNQHSVKEMGSEVEKPSDQQNMHFPTEERTMKMKEDDVWQINQTDLEILDHELLGRGAFAKVVKGRLKGTIPLLVVNATINLVLENLRDGVCEVAVKRLPPHGDQQGVLDFLKEIEFMKQLGYHSHIISMVGCIVSSVSPVILLEYCYHGDLLSFLRKNRPHVLMSDDEDCPIDAELCLRICDLISFSWQISDGVTYLHSKGFIHRDIAARNILLTKSMVAKVSDFGLCRHADSALYVSKGGRLPVKWMAIESLKRFEFSMKSDAWSFGILLHELFSLGDTPYPTVQPMELITYLDGGHRMEQPQICPNEVYALMLNCWDDEPSERPAIDEIGAKLRQMLNIEDEYYGYVTLQNPKSVRYMLNREISEFPASEPKISVDLHALNITDSDSDTGSRPGDYQRFSSTTDMEDFYSVRSRSSSLHPKSNVIRFDTSMETIHEESTTANLNNEGMETWSITTTIDDSQLKLEFSDILTTCHVYPSNHDRPDLMAIDAEMADFYR